MQISSLQNIYKTTLSKPQDQKAKMNFCGDSFTRTISSEEILDKGRHFKLNSYRLLTKKQKNELLKKIPAQIKFDVEQNYKLAQKFKKSLDEKYGKDNYIFECIGTSPAGIGRYLEFTGVEVHYLPISGLHSLTNAGQLCFYAEDEGIKKYGEFLSSQGIKKGMEKETDKKILFYDYTDSWHSLHTFRNILNENYGIPMEFENQQFEYRSLNKDLKELAQNDKEKDDINLYIEAYLQEERIGKYSGVPHMRTRAMKNINYFCKSKIEKDARLFNFYTMYKLEQEGLLKENPANKNSL